MINRPAFLPAIILVAVVSALMLVCSPECCPATDLLAAGTNSRQARQEAYSAIPFSQLNRETQTKLAPVLQKPSLYRRLPVTSIDVDPDMFLYLIRHPEVIVNIWQLMGVTQMTAERTGPFNLVTNDGAGAISNVELVYGTSNLNIYYAEGTYSGPMLARNLEGRAVMILRTEYKVGPDGQPQANNSLDVFLKVENATVSLIAKTLNPIIGPTADHNFVESLNFVQRLNETTEKNGVGVQRMAHQLTDIREDVRNRFIEVAGTVYRRNVQAATQTEAVSQQVGVQSSLSEKYLTLDYRSDTRSTTQPSAVSPPSAVSVLDSREIQPTSYRRYQNGVAK